MKRLLAIGALALLPCAALGQAQPTNGSLLRVERNAVDLKQGMTLDEVQKLLGKPRFTALRNGGGAASAPPSGSLQWTYTWGGSALTERALRVVFAARAPEQWAVESWDWSSY